MKHTTTLITLLIIALLVACSAPEQAPADESAQVAQDNAIERDERKEETVTAPAKEDTTKKSSSDTTQEAGSSTGAATSAPVKEFDMIAQQWEFIPNPIEVNKGDKVILHITSKDVTHGFVLPDFNVNERLTAGATTDVEFIANKAGSFTFFCNVQCGSGHSEMKGQLIVR